jgi:hypothetical protein
MSAMEWWIVDHRYGGWRAVPAETEKEARAWVREGIAESFRDGGLSDSAARRASSSYGVGIVAGGCTEDEAREAVRAWDDSDATLGQRYHDRWIAGTRRKRMAIAPN